MPESWSCPVLSGTHNVSVGRAGIWTVFRMQGGDGVNASRWDVTTYWSEDETRAVIAALTEALGEAKQGGE